MDLASSQVDQKLVKNFSLPTTLYLEVGAKAISAQKTWEFAGTVTKYVADLGIWLRYR